MLILVINVAMFALFFLFLRVLRGVYNQLLDFISPIDDKTPSPLGTLVANVAHHAGQGIAQEIKTTLMGKSSGESRLEKAAQGELALAVAEQNPKMAAIMQAMPAFGKSVRKNPGLLELAMQFLPGLFASGHVPSKEASVTGHGRSGSAPSNFTLG